MVYPETVTHPSINRARHTVTMLIETNALPLSQATTTNYSHYAPRFVTCGRLIRLVVFTDAHFVV